MGRLGHGDRERELLRLLPLIFLGGVLFGAAECVYHRAGPAPLGPLRQDGASYLSFLAIISVAFLLLPSAAGLILRRGGARRVALMWFLALFPTAWIYIDHLARFSHLPGLHYHRPQLFIVETGLLALLATVLATALLRRPSRAWLRARLSLPLGFNWIIFLFIVSLWLFGFPAPPQIRPADSPGAEAPCILLLSIDTLRADDAFGEHAPFMRELASRGVKVQGWAPSPWTRPSFASLFSGVSPTGHGAGKTTAVDAGVNWWPELLAEAGWKTKAVVSNPHLEPGLGFGRGFADFDHSSHLERLEPAAQMVWVRWAHRLLQEYLDRGDRIVHRAVGWLEREPRGPWLLWVHLIDPHVPYHPRGSRGEARDDGDLSWLDPLRAYMDGDAVRDVLALRATAGEMSPEARAALREIYRREVAFVDQQLEKLFSAAEDAAGERPLLWAFASDHGEEFFEHGGLEHGHSLYGELLRVPMFLGGGALPTGTYAHGMRLQDIGPTLLALAGQAPMALRARGMDALEPVLRPYVLGEDRSPELLMADVSDSCAGVRMVAENLLYGTRRTRLFLEDGSSCLRDDELPRFHAVACCGDSAEIAREISVDELSPQALEILQALDRWRIAAGAEASETVDDPALLQRLRSLGYVD